MKLAISPLSKEEQAVIRECSAMLYAVSECDTLYNKKEFFQFLKQVVSHTPMVDGYDHAILLMKRLNKL